jgi:aspartate 1-decarboxylase
MQRVIMKSKIHRATVTRADLGFEGSCAIAPDWIHAGNGAHEQAAVA